MTNTEEEEVNGNIDCLVDGSLRPSELKALWEELEEDCERTCKPREDVLFKV